MGKEVAYLEDGLLLLRISSPTGIMFTYKSPLRTLRNNKKLDQLIFCDRSYG